jgi:hypothetical protein
MKDRREFLKRVAAMGFTTPLIMTVLNTDARASLSGYCPRHHHGKFPGHDNGSPGHTGPQGHQPCDCD